MNKILLAILIAISSCSKDANKIDQGYCYKCRVTCNLQPRTFDTTVCGKPDSWIINYNDPSGNSCGAICTKQ